MVVALRHRHRLVTSEVVDLLDGDTEVEHSCDKGMAQVMGAYMAEARSFACLTKALAYRRIGDDTVPSWATVFAHLAPSVIVSVGADVEDQPTLHDLPKQGLNAFGHPYRPEDSVFRCLAGYDDAGEGGLVEMDPGAGHCPKLFAVPHAGIGQHGRQKAGMGRAVGEQQCQLVLFGRQLVMGDFQGGVLYNVPPLDSDTSFVVSPPG